MHLKPSAAEAAAFGCFCADIASRPVARVLVLAIMNGKWNIVEKRTPPPFYVHRTPPKRSQARRYRSQGSRRLCRCQASRVEVLINTDFFGSRERLLGMVKFENTENVSRNKDAKMKAK